MARKIRKYRVLTLGDCSPTSREKTVAQIIANFSKTDVFFLPNPDIVKSSDLRVRNQIWEIKSPTGGGKNTVLHQFQRSKKQSELLIFDARFINMNDDRALARVKNQLKLSKATKKVMFVRKNGFVEILEK